MNRSILGSILFGTRRERDRATVALSNLLAGLIFTVVLSLAALMFLLPGIIINHIRGRYRGDPHSVRSAVQDWQTWLIALPISLLLLVCLSASGAFRSDRPTAATPVPAPPVTAAASAETGDARPQPEVRRAVAVFPSPEPSVSIAPAPAMTRRAIPVPASPPAALALSAPPDAVAPPERVYAVTGIAPGDTLNVRGGPGMNNGITARLPNGFDRLRIVGAPVMNDTTEWVQVAFGDGSGWVRSQYIKPDSQ